MEYYCLPCDGAKNYKGVGGNALKCSNSSILSTKKVSQKYCAVKLPTDSFVQWLYQQGCSDDESCKHQYPNHPFCDTESGECIRRRQDIL